MKQRIMELGADTLPDGTLNAICEIQPSAEMPRVAILMMSRQYFIGFMPDDYFDLTIASSHPIAPHYFVTNLPENAFTEIGDDVTISVVASTIKDVRLHLLEETSCDFGHMWQAAKEKVPDQTIKIDGPAELLLLTYSTVDQKTPGAIIGLAKDAIRAGLKKDGAQASDLAVSGLLLQILREGAGESSSAYLEASAS